MHLLILSPKWQPFCPGRNVLYDMTSVSIPIGIFWVYLFKFQLIKHAAGMKSICTAWHMNRNVKVHQWPHLRRHITQCCLKPPLNLHGGVPHVDSKEVSDNLEVTPSHHWSSYWLGDRGQAITLTNDDPVNWRIYIYIYIYIYMSTGF